MIPIRTRNEWVDRTGRGGDTKASIKQLIAELTNDEEEKIDRRVLTSNGGSL